MYSSFLRNFDGSSWQDAPFPFVVKNRMMVPAVDEPMAWTIQGERKEIEMNANEAIKNNIEFCRNVLGHWISDFSDADLMARPLPGVNHAAWQIGHLIDPR